MVEEHTIQSELKRKRIGTAKENTDHLLKNVDELRAAEIRDSDVLTKVCMDVVVQTGMRVVCSY